MFMGLRIQNSNFQAGAKWDRGGSLWMYANNALQILIFHLISSNKGSWRQQIFNIYSPSSCHQDGGARRCECTKWYVRSYRLTQVMQVLRQLDSFRGSLTLVNPSSASLVVNQFDVLALRWYTRRLAHLINPSLAEPRGITRPSRQGPGRHIVFSMTTSLSALLFSTLSHFTVFILCIPPPLHPSSLAGTASPSSWLGSLYLRDLLCCFCLHTCGPEVAVVPKQDQL